MEEKKLEISSVAIGVLAFILIFFGFVEGVLLLLGFSLLVQKDPWLTRQILQALYLRILYLAGILVVGGIFKGILFILDLADAYGGMEDILKVQGFIEGVLYIGLLVFALMGSMKIWKGQDAGIPFVSSFAGKTLGDRRIPANRKKSQGVYPQGMQAQGNVPQEEASWRCSCGAQNTGKFCMSCGQQKEEMGEGI